MNIFGRSEDATTSENATLIQRLALAPGMRVADVGAGTGYFALPMARAVAPSGRVFAVDVQPEMLERSSIAARVGAPNSPEQGEHVNDGGNQLARIAY